MPDHTTVLQVESPSAKMATFSVRLPADLIAEIDAIARRLRTPRAVLIREAIVRELERRSQEPAA